MVEILGGRGCKKHAEEDEASSDVETAMTNEAYCLTELGTSPISASSNPDATST